MLRRFKQADVIERPPFFYARRATMELFDAGGPSDGESQVVELHPDDAPPYGIIMTQTCDLDEQGQPTQPWLQVSPVYGLSDETTVNKAYLVELRGPCPAALSPTSASSCHSRRRFSLDASRSPRLVRKPKLTNLVDFLACDALAQRSRMNSSKLSSA
jgi:hypothetical protein